jgi:hypothetical protein
MHKKTRFRSVDFFLATTAASAARVVVTETQSITTTDQTFNFNFGGLPSSGFDGEFIVTLEGDYSPGYPDEVAYVTIESAPGFLKLANTAPGVETNTIPDLSLTTFTRTQVLGQNDWQLNYVFGLSDTFLAELLADNMLSALVVNGPQVDPYLSSNFVRVAFEFTPVPLPAAVRLFGAAILGLAGFAKRRTV